VEKCRLEPLIIGQIFTICRNLLGAFQVMPMVDSLSAIAAIELVIECWGKDCKACPNVEKAIDATRKWVEGCDVM
jgi:hypothetical protein